MSDDTRELSPRSAGYSYGRAGDSQLNDAMSFGRVVYSDGNGTIVTNATTRGMLANEIVYLLLDDDGQSLDDDYQDLYFGWQALSGFTGQHGYNGSAMHPSEYIGGRMERYIRENAGYYVAVVVDGQYANDGHDDDTEDMSIGWALLYRESP